jgi:anti-anti-sigma factor
MDRTLHLIRLERHGDTLVLVPTRSLRELEIKEFEPAARGVMRALLDPAIHHIVIDLVATDYFGSSALSLFLRAWKIVRDRGGRMVLCNVSLHETEILDVCGMHLWPVCSSRAKAFEFIRENAEPEACATSHCERLQAS